MPRAVPQSHAPYRHPSEYPIYPARKHARSHSSAAQPNPARCHATGRSRGSRFVVQSQIRRRATGHVVARLASEIAATSQAVARSSFNGPGTRTGKSRPVRDQIMIIQCVNGRRSDTDQCRIRSGPVHLRRHSLWAPIASGETPTFRGDAEPNNFGARSLPPCQGSRTGCID